MEIEYHLLETKSFFIEQLNYSDFDLIRFYHYRTKPKGCINTVAIFKINWK